MLGPPKSRSLDRPVTVSLEDLIPQGNFYRHLEAKFDLGFVRTWARELYAERGRPSVDPVVFFKLQLIMFFEGIRSERKLIELAGLNLAHRWYLGYALDEPLPDHSSLTRIRQRLGLPIFARFFEQVVDLCQEAGLVWGQDLYFDATKVRANADLDTLVPRFSHEAKAHLADLFAGEAADTAVRADVVGVGDVLPDGITQLPSAAGAEHPPAGAEPPWRLLEERRLDPQRGAAWGYERTSAWRVSPTDPDATPMQTGNGVALGYHDHYVVDGGKARIVLAALVTPADVMENVPMRDLLWRVCFRRKLRPHHVTGGAVEKAGIGIRAYVPLPDFNHRTPFYGKDRFVYDAEHDEYHCPQGHPLRRLTTKFTEQQVAYRADAALCNACPAKAACTASDRGRVVHRSFYAAYLERVRGYHATEPYAKAMRKRKVWVEPLFAEAKDWHGLRRFRLRGLANVNSEGLLIAAGQNLKRFLAATGWGHRSAPCGNVLAVSTEPRWLAAVHSEQSARPRRRPISSVASGVARTTGGRGGRFSTGWGVMGSWGAEEERPVSHWVTDMAWPLPWWPSGWC